MKPGQAKSAAFARADTKNLNEHIKLMDRAARLRLDWGLFLGGARYAAHA